MRREFSHVKLALLLTLVLKYELRDSWLPSYHAYFERDLRYCSSCFQGEIERCHGFFLNLDQGPSDPFNIFLNLLPFNNKRLIRNFNLKNNNNSIQLNPNESATTTVVVAKYLSGSKLHGLQPVPDLKNLRQSFEDLQRLDGFQFCSNHNVQRFVRYFKTRTYYDEPTIWLHMLLNVQSLLLPELWQLNFPVPRTYAICGFTQYQSHAGQALVHFYDAEFQVKLRISMQLLKAAAKFTEGFDGFRIYITDLSGDNMAYNAQDDALYFVDLDTVLIADSSQYAAQQGPRTVHKHNYIECDNCFAYSPQDICAHHLSDFNIFAACQFLREDLRSDRLRGFLQPIPSHILEAYPEITRLLDQCVDCVEGDCGSRLSASEALIKLFSSIFNKFY